MPRNRVLVIDDDPGVRLLMETILRELDCDVTLARNGHAGLEQLREGPVDVLFLDLRLPDEDAFRIASQAKALAPEIAVVLVTGYPSVTTSVAAWHQGFSDYVSKPVTRDKIHRALVRAAMAKGGSRTGGGQDPGDGAGPEGLKGPVVAASPAMKRVLRKVREAAGNRSPVLLVGEPGVGKALLARALHHNRTGGQGMFFHLHCRGVRQEDIPAVWSRATAASAGTRRGQAATSSWFLENVNELPLWAQYQLIGLLERAGPEAWAMVRLIASASCELEAEVCRGRFARPLYYLLDVVRIPVPPLRRRREDIRPLAEQWLDRFARCRDSPDPVRCSLSPPVWDRLIHYDWPGNGDELANLLHRVVLRAAGSPAHLALIDSLLEAHRPAASPEETITVPLTGGLKSIQRRIICEVIDRCSGNKAAAARALGLHRKTIYRLLEGERPARSRTPGPKEGHASGQAAPLPAMPADPSPIAPASRPA